jgi:hypothetical protein
MMVARGSLDDPHASWSTLRTNKGKALVSGLRLTRRDEIQRPTPVPKMSSIGIDWVVGKLNPAKVIGGGAVRSIEGIIDGTVTREDAELLIDHALRLFEDDRRYLADLRVITDGTVIRWQEVQTHFEYSTEKDEFDRLWQVELWRLTENDYYVAMKVVARP